MAWELCRFGQAALEDLGWGVLPEDGKGGGTACVFLAADLGKPLS